MCVVLYHRMCAKYFSREEEGERAITFLRGGDCTHNWADIGYTVCAMGNGHVAAQGNHSPADAMTALYMIRW